MVLAAALWTLAAASPVSTQMHTLAIRHATVFDTETRTTRPETTILVRGDRIAAVLPDAEARSVRAVREIDARGKLVTPGLIDVHHHLDYVFPDSITPGGGAVSFFVMRADSIARYRERWARAYLPYGVTVVRSVGDNESHMPLLAAWQRPSPAAPDFFPVGGALVSYDERRATYPGHAAVRGVADARAKVASYHAACLRDVKLYWRLREPDLIAALAEARRLDMRVTADVGLGSVTVLRALALGVRHFEHAFNLASDVLTDEQRNAAWARTRAELGDRMPGGFFWGTLEQFNTIGADNARMQSAIAELARAGATVTPTIHLFALRAGVAPHVTAPVANHDDDRPWTAEQRARARRGYDILARTVRDMHRAGVQLAIGTDWFEPGPAVLSEMLLFHEAGIPMADVLSIATLGSAKVMEREADYGRIAPGRKAHLVVFDESPVVRPRALFGGKTVIKDGVVASQ